MFEASCQYCGCGLRPDFLSSYEDFLTRVNYKEDDIETIRSVLDNTHLSYVCVNCTSVFKYTLSELEQLIKDRILKDVMNLRKKYIFMKDIIHTNIDPDNGLVFCGRCAGVEEGYCYKDIINTCSLRKQYES